MSNASGCSRSAALFPLGTGLQMLGFALMAGGMVALGAFTAPVVFHQFPRDLAAPAMATIFRRYDVVLLIALGLVVLGEALRWFFGEAKACSKLAMVRTALLAALSICLLYATLVVNPKIAEMNQAGWHRDLSTAEGRALDRTHKRSESLYKLDLLLVMALILLTPFVDARTARGASSESGKAHA